LAHILSYDTLCRMIGYEPISKFGDDEAPTLGRIAEVPPISAIDLAMKVKAKLECQAVRFTGDPTRMIRRIGFCGGDGKSFIYPAIENGCDAFITGDAGYNIATDAAEEGLITIEAGHFHTEFPVCVAIKDFIASFSDVKCEIYRDCPYHIV